MDIVAAVGIGMAVIEAKIGATVTGQDLDFMGIMVIQGVATTIMDILIAHTITLTGMGTIDLTADCSFV